MGAGGLYIKKSFFGYEKVKPDYSELDSIFFRSGKNGVAADTTKLSDKKVDYEPELLDFSENELLTESNTPDSSLIDLNKADLSILMTLPGIGEVTAQKIIDLRERRHGFKNLDELLLVKGIGKSKLDKIKKFLIIE